MTAFSLANRDEADFLNRRQIKEEARSTRVRLTSCSAPPGGRTARYIETWCRRPLSRSARRGGVLVVDGHGHAASVLRPDHRLLFQPAGAGQVSVRDARREQPDGPDGVVVTRNREVDQLRIAVRVDDRDHRDPQLVGFGDGDVFLLRVDHEERVRQLAHVADPLEVLRHLLPLALQPQLLLLGQRAVLVGEPRLDLLQTLDRGAERDEVGQRAAEPAVGDGKLTGPPRFLGDGLLGLPLGADEQDPLAFTGEPLYELSDLVEQLERLLQVDDVDSVTLAEDIRLHLRVPTPGLVPEVDASLQQLLHRDFYQGLSLLGLYLVSSA